MGELLDPKIKITADAEYSDKERRRIRREMWQMIHQEGLEKSILVAPVDVVIGWMRMGSVWPVTFGLACCAIEMMATGAARYDIDRFGAGAFRATPRQADLMIVAGTVTYKMAPRVKRLWEQMPEPKYVMALGACAMGGGPYALNGYHIVNGVDKIVPVDVYVAGCPPRPEALLEGLMRIQEKILSEHPIAGFLRLYPDKQGRSPIDTRVQEKLPARKAAKTEETPPAPPADTPQTADAAKE